MASSRRSFANHCRILLRARGDLTKASQSRDGPAPSAFDVKISIVSPAVVQHRSSSATSLPLTRAPMQRCPHLGVHCIGEIDRCRPAGQCDDVALRREDVDLHRTQVVAGSEIEELLRLLGLTLPVEELAQPSPSFVCDTARPRPGHPSSPCTSSARRCRTRPGRGASVQCGSAARPACRTAR